MSWKRSIYKFLAAIALIPLPAIGQEVSATAMIGYVEMCSDAVGRGEVEGFAHLNVETEVTTDTTLIRGWRGSQYPGLVISLIRRTGDGGTLGMCDVAFLPGDGDAGLQGEIAEGAARYWQGLADDPDNRPDPDGMGRAILTCMGGQGVSVFIDTENLSRGFNAQVARVSGAKMNCEG